MLDVDDIEWVSPSGPIYELLEMIRQVRIPGIDRLERRFSR
jgi:hypothetical protein